MKTETAPIALFVYNRPDHVKQTIEALAKNALAEQSDLYIFSDGPKSDQDLIQVKQVRDLFENMRGFRSVNLIKQDVNIGLAKSIIQGVSELVEKYGEVIVLEDDIVTSPYFLQFMNNALDYYQDQEQVMHISGYMFPIENKGLQDTFFLRTASCWGWATWDRAWKFFEKDPLQLIQSFDKKMIRRFNMDGTYDFWGQVLKNEAGEINTWAVFWYATIFQRQGLCLHPAVSMTVNIGIDGSGSHCGNSNVFNTTLAQRSDLHFEQILQENSLALKKTKDFFASLTPSFFVRFRQKLRAIFQ